MSGTMFTLNQTEVHAVAYALTKFKDDGNPHSGCHTTEVSCTLDRAGGHPNCEQGGGADR